MGLSYHRPPDPALDDGKPLREISEGWYEKMKGEAIPPTLAPMKEVDVIYQSGLRFFGCPARDVARWDLVVKWREHEVVKPDVESMLEAAARAAGLDIKLAGKAGKIAQSPAAKFIAGKPETGEQMLTRLLGSEQFQKVQRALNMNKPDPEEEIQMPEVQTQAAPVYDDPENPWNEKLLGAGRPFGITFGTKVDVVYSNDERRSNLDPSKDVRDWRAVVKWRIHSDPPQPEGYVPAEETDEILEDLAADADLAARNETLEARVATLRNALDQVRLASTEERIVKFCREILHNDSLEG